MKPTTLHLVGPEIRRAELRRQIEAAAAARWQTAQRQRQLRRVVLACALGMAGLCLLGWVLA